MSMTRTLLLALIIALLSPALASAASPRLGLSDPNPELTAQPLYQQLRIKPLRIIVPWNLGSRMQEPGTQRIRDAISAGFLTGKEVHLALNVAGYNEGDNRKRAGKTAYARSLNGLLRAYPRLRVITPWNEANHDAQPVAKRPELAAAYFDITRRRCPRCKVIAADLLDAPGWQNYLKRYKKALRTKARIWGFHNYKDANRFPSWKKSFTRNFLRQTKGEVWATETGGIHSFTTKAGRIGYRPDDARQARATKYLMRLQCRKEARRVKRFYIYQWFSDANNRFDSGQVSPSGVPRPVLGVLQRYQARGCASVR